MHFWPLCGPKIEYAACERGGRSTLHLHKTLHCGLTFIACGGVIYRGPNAISRVDRSKDVHSLMMLAAETKGVVALRIMKLMRGGKSAGRGARLN